MVEEGRKTLRTGVGVCAADEWAGGESRRVTPAVVDVSSSTSTPLTSKPGSSRAGPVFSDERSQRTY